MGMGGGVGFSQERESQRLFAAASAAMSPSTAAASDLRQKVVGGLGWKLLTQIITQGSRTIVAILLAHLLTPHDFGLAAMALVFTSFAWIFTDLSLGSALIQ